MFHTNLKNDLLYLQYYNVKKPVTIWVDVSQSGVRALITQENRPVAYTSKAFTSAQTRYAQNEKELAAIVFSCERFHKCTHLANK